MSELMKETETKAVRALSDLISSDGGTLHNLRMILRAAIAQAVQKERKRIREGVDFIIKKEATLEPVYKEDCAPLLEEVIAILEADND